MELNKETILETLRNVKPTLASQFNIEKLGLFGSFATGKATEQSDIDIVYELKEGSHLGLEDLIAFEKYLQKCLKFSKLDVVNYKYMNPVVKYFSKDSIVYA